MAFVVMAQVSVTVRVKVEVALGLLFGDTLFEI